MESELEYAIDYFKAALEERKDVRECVSRCVASLYGLPGGSFANEDLALIRDFIDDLSYRVEDENGEFDYGIDARDHKAAFIHKELTPYV